MRGPGEEELSSIQAFIGFDHADRASLLEYSDELLGAIEPALDALYTRMRDVEKLRPIVTDPQRVASARRHQAEHWRKMIRSPFQGDYLSTMRSIGTVHARLGVEPIWMMGAHAILLSQGLRALRDTAGSEAVPAALAKMFLIDAFYAIAVYNEEIQVRRRAAERELSALNAERSRVLQVFERALTELSNGNLDVQIEDGLPETVHLAVRQFNDAIRRQKELVSSIEHKAIYDPLTELFNRQHFFDFACRLVGTEQACATAPGSLMRLELIDLDGFKFVNDTLGHDAGDHCLKVTAERLRLLTPPGSSLFRIGGDEFAILRPLETIDETVDYDAFLKGLAEPIPYDTTSLVVGASMGYINVHEYPNKTSKELLRKADLALYAAKRGGKAQACAYMPKLMRKALDDAAVIRACRKAAAEGRLRLYYQPKVDLRTGELRGLEALLRMVDEAGSIVEASQMLPAFIDGGCQRLIGDFVLDEAVNAIKQMKASSFRFHHVAINLGTLQFSSPSVAEKLEQLLATREIEAEDIQIEVTEGVILSGGDLDIQEHLARISALGVKISLDDFGTGYASLSHIQKFPIDSVKIDRSFVRDIHANGENLQIVKAVIVLCRSLGKDVIAEGIDSCPAADELIHLGCNLGQGYLYSPAVELRALQSIYPTRQEEIAHRRVTAMRRAAR